MEIIVLSSYFQSAHATANGLCARAVCQALRQQGHGVRVICYASPGDAVKEEGIVEIPEKRDAFLQGSGMQLRLRAYARTAREICSPWYDGTLVKHYVSALSRLLQQKKADMIIAMYFPLETVLAAAAVKAAHPQIKTVVYELDSAGDGISNGKALDHLKERAFERRMEGLYARFDGAVVMKSHEAYWRKTHGRHVKKMRVADIPMITPAEHGEEERKAEKQPCFTCLYAGLLDAKHRNPGCFLQLLAGINGEGQLLKAHFYSKGDCEETLKAIEKQHAYLETHGYVAKDVLDAAGRAATCFLSLGNGSSNSVPSKLFFYISTGKPILHMAPRKEDVCVEYLKRYPMALVLYEGDPLQENILRLRQFLLSRGGQAMDGAAIRQLYAENTPEFSAALIEAMGK